jgi:hypothetical protein
VVVDVDVAVDVAVATVVAAARRRQFFGSVSCIIIDHCMLEE